MKLLEFLETIRENDSSGPGTFVGARLTRDSERAIMRWMRDNGLRKKEPRARFHITVVGDQSQDFPWNPATFDPPLEVDPNSYKLEKFGDAIVLSFSVPELEKRHEAAIKKYGIRWSFPVYQPHLTLSFDPTGLNNMERLLLPTFPMYVANEYVQPWEFNEDDSRTERRRSERFNEGVLTESVAEQAFALLMRELDSGIDDAYHDFENETGNDMNDLKSQAAFDAWVGSYAERRIADATKEITRGATYADGRMIIHRAIEADEGWAEKIAEQKLGNHWTWDEDAAQPYAGWGGDEWHITATVDPNDIDWVQTILMNAHPAAHEEREIVVPSGTSVVLMNLTVDGEQVDPSRYQRGQILQASKGT